MRVLKFGGKSLSTIEKMQNICKYIKKIYKNDKKIIVVVSAMGTTTNNLISQAKEIDENLTASRELAQLLSTGEIVSASLFSMCLNKIGVPAKSLTAHQIDLCTFGDYQDSKIYYLNKKKLSAVIDLGTVCVVTGFQGIAKNGDTTLLGRGGSDTTAVAISGVFGVNAEIYSDYAGIFSGDPKYNNFKKLPKLSYQTMEDMADGGSKVLAKRATQLAMRFNTNILAKSSTEPQRVGSVITNIEENQITISACHNLCFVTITYDSGTQLEAIIKKISHTISNHRPTNLHINGSTIVFAVYEKFADEVVAEIAEKLKLLKNK